jgi:hypothetical protein
MRCRNLETENDRLSNSLSGDRERRYLATKHLL